MNSKVLTNLSKSILRGTVAEIDAAGAIHVDIPRGKTARRIVCDFLQTSDGPRLTLQHKDTVLVLLPGRRGERGCVLGRVANYRDAGTVREIHLEAEQGMTLSCGAASLELKPEGTVRVQGMDVEIRGEATTRIVGATVHIN